MQGGLDEYLADIVYGVLDRDAVRLPGVLLWLGMRPDGP